MKPSDGLTITTPSDREIVTVRALAAPRALVFDCMIRPEFLTRWMLGPDGWTMPVCEFEPRVGGRFRYVWRNADGGEMGMGGVIREFEPPKRIVNTQLFDGDETGGESIVTLTLTEAGGVTLLTTSVLYPSRETRDAMLQSGMADGMEAGYRRMDALLAEMGR
ncbi:uncharacterized protein YndB with AHSA1/START domain [Caulobacter ginsengisoli]|uniref:Uncharacterized protein YndB with AHSA1/START domain n=1 Tax=Caulobacter ginsengisoli TaxID=400775 RepID=A0ABU0IQ71_9CAUL|nr:SRPBCC family protein [Caulobacter ginsengisoli]MDQ0463169.1 uncharacterized protein YndB with AHSA1/START domain [Caulobacter ginsengisoli]